MADYSAADYSIIDYAPSLAQQYKFVVAVQDIPFSSAGVNQGNVSVIYGEGLSYVPGRTINGIDGFKKGKGYCIVKLDEGEFSQYLYNQLAN